MHSCISSSSERYPAGRCFLTWLVGFILAASVLCVLELFFRTQGYEPSVVDDQQLWAFHRHRVYFDGEKQTVVLLGASRIQLGFSPNVFEQCYSRYRVVQLAIGGGYPVATLRDLADDERFSGIVICSITAAGFLRHCRDEQQSFVCFYDKCYRNGWWQDDEFNRSIATLLQRSFAIFGHLLRVENIVTSLVRHKSLPSPYLIMHSDRSISADYTKLDIAAHRTKRVERVRRAYMNQPPPNPEEWLVQVREIEPLIQRIQNRGGLVVFVRYVTTGKHYELDEKYYPKKEYWDRFAKITSAVMIHFKDVPALSNFDCPDSSHLDFRDVPRFTMALADELVQRSVILP